jgi:hypothetical protein
VARDSEEEEEEGGGHGKISGRVVNGLVQKGFMSTRFKLWAMRLSSCKCELEGSGK